MLKTNVIDCFNGRLKRLLLENDWNDINEIRIRVGKAAYIEKRYKRIFYGC